MERDILYVTTAVDVAKECPVVVIDSTALSPHGALPDPLSTVPKMLGRLPPTPFSLVYFASRGPMTPQISWIWQVHSLLTRELKKRILHVYIVHAKWYIRALNKALTPIVSPKFLMKQSNVRDLSELSRFLDITAIDIAPQVYLDDIARSNSRTLGAISIPKNCTTIFSLPLKDTPCNYWRAALQFLGNQVCDASVFAPLTKADSEELKLIAVLTHAVAREQKLRLYDYGPFVVLAVLKDYLLSLPTALISFESLEFPMSNSIEYVDNITESLTLAHQIHLRDLVQFSRSSLVDRKLIARSLGPSVLGLINPPKETMWIATNFFELILRYWDIESLSQDTSQAAKSASTDPVARKALTTLQNSESPQQPAASNSNVPATKISEIGKDFMENESRYENYENMPRNLSGKIAQLQIQQLPPNRRTFGRVTAIVQKYTNINQRI